MTTKMGALAGLIKIAGSQTALVGGAIVIGATVLCAIGKIPWNEWKDVALWIGVAFVGGEKMKDTAAAWRDGAKKPSAK